MSIFLSHTHADKALVEPIAERLAQAFGRDTVFYDSWSIQPGDGIVDKMNEALGGGPAPLWLYRWLRYVIPGAILTVGIWWLLTDVFRAVGGV